MRKQKMLSHTGDKKVSRLHLIYLWIIFVIVHVFILVICPGRINENALSTISFAATITSIVLAVVSIVYTLQSGNMSLQQLASIKDVENKISHEVGKFPGMERAIKDAINALRSCSDNIQQCASDINHIKDSQESVASQIADIYASHRVEQTVEQGHSASHSTSTDKNSWTPFFYVVFYACRRCAETKKNFPLKLLSKDGVFYSLGMIQALNAFQDDVVKITKGKGPLSFGIEHIDFDKIGLDMSMDFRQIMQDEINDKKSLELCTKILDGLDAYFDECKDPNAVE